MQLCKAATNLRRSMSSCTLQQPPQSPLRRALSIFQKVDQLRGVLAVAKKSMGVHSAEGYRNPRTSHSSVVKSWWYIFFPSVAADLALRLGPDSERSGKIVCKK